MRDTHVIYSFGGNGNLGDDLILDSWLRYFDSRKNAKRILVNSHSDWLHPLYADYDCVKFNGFLEGVAYSALSSNTALENRTVGDALDAGTNAAISILEHYTLWKPYLTHVSAFHVAGGGFLNDYYTGSIAIVSLMSKLAEELQVPMVGTGWGFGPFNTDAELLAPLLRRFSWIETRDNKSFSILQRFLLQDRLIAGIDDTFLGRPLRRPHAAQPTILWLNVQEDMNVGNQHEFLLEKISQVLTTLRKRQEVRLGYLKFFEWGDSAFLSKLQEKIDVDIVLGHDDLLLYGMPFKAGDFCIASRFHCHLFAARTGVRGYFISNSEAYYDTKHESLLELGSNWGRLDDVSNLDPCELLYPALSELVLTSKKSQVANKIE